MSLVGPGRRLLIVAPSLLRPCHVPEEKREMKLDEIQVLKAGVRFTPLSDR